MASLAERITRCLHSLFECELASFDLVDVSAVRWNTLVISPVIPDWDVAVATLQRFAHEHPILSHATRSGDPGAIRISDLLSLRRYQQTGIYHEFFRPYVEGMDRQLGFVANPTPTLACGASVNRRGRDFSPEQRAVMELLRPHLLRAHALAQAHEQMREREHAVCETAATAAGGGLCQAGADGGLEWMTAAVGPVLARYFPGWHAGLKLLPAGLVTRLRAALVHPRDQSQASLALGRSWDFPRAFGTLKVRLAAFVEPGRWQLFFAEEPGELPAETLATRHGLSRREAETLFWIGQGKTNEEIGTLLSISPRTVEKHAEHVFETLCVYNRTAAARVAIGG